MQIEEILLIDLQPSQFYLSQEKIDNIKTWFRTEDLSNFEPLPVKLLNGKLILTDGHTRAFIAYSAGLSKVPLVWESEELDWEAYEKCVDACEERGVRAVSDFQDRILSKEDYAVLWNGWCDTLHNLLRGKGKEQ